MEPVPPPGRYARHFERMQASGRTWLPGWNWAAFLHSTGWFWYRRMYAWAILNLIAPALVLALLVFVVQWFVPEGRMDVALGVLGGAYLLLVYALLPVYADSLYLYRLAKDGKAPKAPSLFTAAGAAVLVVVPAAFAWAVAQAQIDYQHRERLAEGAERAYALRSSVAEFYAVQRRLPDASEAARFRDTEPMKFTASVGWDAARGAIVAVMGERYPGGRIELVPAPKDGGLAWTCRSSRLEKRYLRGDCRD